MRNPIHILRTLLIYTGSMLYCISLRYIHRQRRKCTFYITVCWLEYGGVVSIEKIESIFKKNIWSSTLECHPLTSVSQGKAQEPLLEDLSTSHFPHFIYIYKHRNRFTYKNKQNKPKQQQSTFHHIFRRKTAGVWDTFKKIFRVWCIIDKCSPA